MIFSQTFTTLLAAAGFFEIIEKKVIQILIIN